MGHVHASFCSEPAYYMDSIGKVYMEMEWNGDKGYGLEPDIISDIGSGEQQGSQSGLF
jgi:hypothetical protein